MELTGRNTAEKIWNYLLNEGYTPAGVAGIMASLDCESALKPNNLEDKFQSSLGTDTYYTAAVNSKIYTKEQFINDRAGYGLAQWTYFTRKRGLYEETVEKGLSIADLKGQLDYLVKEIKSGYKSLDNILRTSKDVNTCSDTFLRVFEAPAILNYNTRRNYAKKYYNLYSKGMPTSVTEEINPDETEYKTYTVQKNDSWWSIAQKVLGSGSKMVELAKFNNKTVNTQLHPGMILILPELKEEAINVNNNTSVTKPNTKLYTLYTVCSGDSWWKIAAKRMGNGNKMAELAKFNNRNTMSTLYVGETIKIPIEENKNTHSNTDITYTVKPGDGWYSIALSQLGDGNKMHTLASYNGKTIKDMLHPGNVLKIPKK